MFTEIALQITGMLGIANMQQNNATYNLTDNETDELLQTDTQAWDVWTLQLGAGLGLPLSDDGAWFTTITPQINYYILNIPPKAYIPIRWYLFYSIVIGIIFALVDHKILAIY